ncbi:MAG: hypothetical protein R6V85_02270 [Polyangia bacterium]
MISSKEVVMIRPNLTALAMACAVLGLAALAWAQQQEQGRQAGSRQEAPLLGQSYHGTRPGGGNTLPRVEELKGLSDTWVTWPGFIMREDGGSRLFLQTTRSIDFSRTDKDDRITLRLERAKVYLSNNRNPLVTSHFNTPIGRAYLRRHRNWSELVIELKVEATAVVTQTADADGYHYLFVDFPAGQYPTSFDTSGPRPSFSGWGDPALRDDEVPPGAGDRSETAE